MSSTKSTAAQLPAGAAPAKQAHGVKVAPRSSYISWAGMAFLTIHTLGMSPERGQGFGVLALLVLVLIGYTILQKVDDKPRNWTVVR